MKQIRTILSLLAVLPSLAIAQDAATIQRAVSGLEWREIGPATMGGRISDLAVLESNPAVFYVGTATAGIWKTTNHGTTWTPLFDEQETSSIGDVTLAPSNPNVVWVGTGEHQNRQSSPWGAGVYRSTDAGRTWTHLGLTDTRHISRIVVHLRDPDVAWVGAVGHLWGPNEERGVYKTTDGGQTWERVLYVDENTGVIDLVGDPGDPETLYAAMYQRRRTAFGFNGGGPGSGIYRTTDGGATWTELTEGLPEGDMGRIGPEVYRRDGNLVYAVVEARGDAQGVYRSTDRGGTWEQMSQENPRPMYFSKIRIDPNDPERIYLGGVQLHISSDGGRTFVRDAREVHSDHHALWIDPGNSNHLIMGSDGGISVSFDRAESWRMYDNLALGQFYEIGFDMQDPYFVCGGLQDNGSWCGPSATWSTQGIRNHNWFNIHGGDGFYAQIDPTDPTVIFAESQNGNISRVDVTTGERQSIRPLMRDGDDMEDEDNEDDDYRWNWNTPIHISVHNRQTIYAGANVLAKSTDQGRSWTIISPDLTRDLDRSTIEIMGVRENRMLSRHDGVSSYGTITTIAESPLDANVLYVGTDDGNLQVTRDGGTTWTNVVDRLSELPERTYVSRVVASHHAAGTVYATFDGHYADDYRPYVYVSTDYGDSWRRITNGLPDWSVNVLAEHPRTGNLLFVGNEVGVFFSTDRGAQWHRLDNNLPTVPVDDIKIHPRENDLILGTHGRSIWIMDDIAPLEQLSAEVLAADVHAFPVGQATLVNRNSPQGWTPGAFETSDGPTDALIRYYLGRDIAPTVTVTDDEPAEQGPMASNGQDDVNGDTAVTITILDASGTTVRTLDGPGDAGLHQVEWDLRMNPPYEVDEDEQRGFFGGPRGPLVMPGTYTARVDAHGTSRTVEIPVRGDPRIQISMADRQVRQDAMMTLNALGKPLHDAGQALERVVQQVESAKKLLADAANAPDALKAEADSLSEALDDAEDDVNGASRTALRLFFTIERATMRPTADQMWQLDETWEDATEAIEQLNVLLTERIPAFHQRLNAEGIRPDPGSAIALPTRP